MRTKKLEPAPRNALWRAWAQAMARPVVPAVAIIGFLLVAFFLALAFAGRTSAYGCIDREAGRAQTKDIGEYRKKATSLRNGALEKHYRQEARRQEERNADAERRCGQPGMPFELAMRRIDAEQSLLSIASTLIFGFCTLASVLVAVSLADEAGSREGVGWTRSARRNLAGDADDGGAGAARREVDEHGRLSSSGGRLPDSSSPTTSGGRPPRDAEAPLDPTAADVAHPAAPSIGSAGLILVSGAIASALLLAVREVRRTGMPKRYS